MFCLSKPCFPNKRASKMHLQYLYSNKVPAAYILFIEFSYYYDPSTKAHSETKFFCIRNAEMPQSFHRTWWCAQSNKTSRSVIQCCFHGDEKRGAPSPYRLRLQGRWVNAVTTSGSLCLIWTQSVSEHWNSSKSRNTWQECVGIKGRQALPVLCQKYVFLFSLFKANYTRPSPLTL